MKNVQFRPESERVRTRPTNSVRSVFSVVRAVGDLLSEFWKVGLERCGVALLPSYLDDVALFSRTAARNVAVDIVLSTYASAAASNPPATVRRH